MALTDDACNIDNNFPLCVCAYVYVFVLHCCIAAIIGLDNTPILLINITLMIFTHRNTIFNVFK